MVKYSLNEIEAMKIAELINNLDEEVEKYLWIVLILFQNLKKGLENT